MEQWDSYVINGLLRVILIAGLVYLFVVRRRSHRAIWYAMAALVALFLTSGAVFTAFDVYRWLGAAGFDKRAASIGFRISMWVYHIVHVAGLGLLIWSVAADRRSSAHPDSPA
ncbi:MAG TPA: hypothetical protein VFG68_10585 [Fimbriiglobus sp.]|nr:hypothetical protein [Fimbriiglobus sp.]